ncbi:unnamed protein product, partial [marine sediment metagenome]
KLEDLSKFIKERKLPVYESGHHNQKKFIQILPGLSNSDLDLDGFFMAKMIRKE